MEAKASLKKRRRLSSHSDAVAGVLTRSRSEAFFHRNRSGRAWPDPESSRRRCVRAQSLELRNSIEETFNGDDDVSVSSVKDLRARRVFSPTTAIGDEKGSTGKNGEDDAKIEFDLGFVQENEKACEDDKIESVVKDEWLQSTPPDDEIVRKSEQNPDIAAENPSSVIAPPGSDSYANQDEKKNYSNEKTRSGVIAFRSRMKLFKNPSSFSYRRLLPYLMDLAKDNSNALEIHPSQKVEKTVEEKPVPYLSISQDSLMNRSNKEFSSDGKFGATDAPIIQSNETICMGSSEADYPNLLPHETSNVSGNHDSVIRTQFNSNDESATQLQPDMSDNSSKLEQAQDSNGSVQEKDPLVQSVCSPLIAPESLSATEDALVGLSYVPKEVEEDDSRSKVPEIRADVKPLGPLGFHQDQTYNVDLVPSENLMSGMTKGILKRHPRGCRGICNCITCAAFRLHAERAFEFSRNQLQDAEEVAVGLMKELSCLRSLLEKSVNVAECHDVSEFSEVREACRKASRTEELAKSHIRDMKLELNIHSRTTCLQRPRVKFSDVEPIVPMTLNYDSQFK